MSTQKLDTLMLLYARRGIDDWKKAKPIMRRNAAQCLGMNIADNETEAAVTINTAYSPGFDSHTKGLWFIPMPKMNKRGIERCFFLPIRRWVSDGWNLSFDLFILVSNKNCLAFRFEPAHAYNSRHNYPHVQPSRRLLLKSIQPNGVPEWLPESYPAFPIPAKNPLGIFLSMVVSVHGFHGGLDDLLPDVLKQANRSNEICSYMQELQDILMPES